MPFVYGKESLWLHATRRGSYFELETTRTDSKTLYGHVLRAVASKKGEPGSRWPLIQVYKSQVSPAQVGAVSRSQRYPRNSVSGIQNPEETTTDDHLRYNHLRCQTRAGLRTASRAHLKPGGYQHRGAHGGSQRGQRSEEAQTRRYNLWRARRSASRQDYRQWKTHQQDVALKVHGNNRPPPFR